MSKLYELSDQYSQALSVLDADEFDEETIADTLEGLRGEVEDKMKNVAAFQLNLRADISKLDEHIKLIQKRKKAMQAKDDYFRRYLKDNMIKTDITKIETPFLTVSLRKSPPSVIVDDIDAVPDKFKTEKVVVSADKRAILDADGCAGVHIERDNKTVMLK